MPDKNAEKWGAVGLERIKGRSGKPCVVGTVQKYFQGGPVNRRKSDVWEDKQEESRTSKRERTSCFHRGQKTGNGVVPSPPSKQGSRERKTPGLKTGVAVRKSVKGKQSICTKGGARV